MIELTNVSYSYEGRAALREVALTVSRGDSVALLGPNGSGKSTLLKLLSGIVLADSGSYRFDGESVTRATLKDQASARRFHQRIGYLFQNAEAQLFCPSVLEEVTFGPRQMGFDEPEVARRARDCLGLLGISFLADRPPWGLSDGEKKKVALASVLSLNPEVLVLDEPMNGLDPRTKRFLRELVISLRQAGKTILCATHDFPYVRDVFSTAVVFSAEHRLVRIGPFEEVVSDTAFLEGNNLI